MIDAPTGTVTFLFADTEYSMPPGETPSAGTRDTLARRDRILRRAVEANGGSVFGMPQGTFGAVFATVKQGVGAAMAAQRSLSAGWNGHDGERVRIALHTEVAEVRDGDPCGPAERAARLLSAGRGGQVLLSANAYEHVRGTGSLSELGAEVRRLVEHPPENARDSERIFQLVVPDSDEGATLSNAAHMYFDERYDPKELIGSGGMAEVYLARDGELDRDVAIKRLRPQYAHDEEAVERFEREAKSAASLSHANIVQVYDRGETEDGSYYIVMEHVPGGTLKDRIHKHGPLPPHEAVAIALQIARALKAAHDAGVVHRDVKPQNVVLTELGEAKVADFGIARAVAASTVTRTGFVVGTAHYLSPEQALGHPATPRSDLYSVGVVLYEMLTGRVPHDAETQVGVLMKHVSGRPVPAKDANPEVPEELDAMIARLLARDPEDRYRDVDELIEDLERVQRGESLTIDDTHQMERLLPSPPTRVPGEDDRRGWRWVLVPLTLLLLAFLGGTAFAFGPWRAAPEAVVPHLVGADSIEDARELVGGRFEVVEGNRVKGTGAVGTIAAQDPYAGELADVGTEISLDVVGTRIADVPDVRGKTREEAGRVLKEAGFQIEVETTRSSADDENLVITQRPSGNADEPAKVGSSVAITVGQGPGSVEIPSVDGQAVSAAGQILEEAGLKLGSRMEVPNDRVPAGHIVQQHPIAGTEVEPGSNVDVVVGSGPQQPPTPNAEVDEQPIASKVSASAAGASTTSASSAPALAAEGEPGFERETAPASPAPASPAPASRAPASTAPASPAPASPTPALAAAGRRGFEHEGGLEDEFGRNDSSGPGSGGGHGGPGRH